MEEPQTPNSALSEGPCPPRNSMEDADSSVTRKRPRLDSGDRTYRSMSADEIEPDQVTPEPDHLLPNADGTVHEPMPILSSDNTKQHSLSGTPSKVTINVRDKMLESSSPHQNSAAKSATAVSDRVVHSSPAISAINIASTPPGDVVVLSSPTRSPEIEVAEIEDMDDDPHQTRWKPMVSITNIEDLQSTLLENFLFADKYVDIRECIGYLSQVLEKGDTQGGALLKHFAEWIETYLEQTAQYPSHWWTLYLQAKEFWDELPIALEAFLRRQTRLERSFFQSQESDQGGDQPRCIQDLLTACAALVARMVQIDCIISDNEDAKITSDPVSAGYLRTMNWIFSSPNPVSIWKLLDEGCKYDSRPVIAAIVDRFFQEPVHGGRKFLQYIRLLSDRSHTHATCHYCVSTALELLNHVTQYRIRSQDPMYSPSIAQPFQLAPTPSEILRIFQYVDLKLQTFVSKQVTTFSSEICKLLIINMSMLLQSLLLADSGLVSTSLPSDFDIKQDITGEHQAYLIQHAWKYQLLKKCIKHGRMEVRVQGVEIMQQDLVTVYNLYIRNIERPTPHPIVQYLAKLILEDKLVNYIVGPESHPNLMGRATNIVGFLIVADQYTEVETNIVWKTVEESQDIRTIDAVIDMIVGFLNIAPYHVLIYLCEKLNELPVGGFDTHMLAYCRKIIDAIGVKWRELPPQKLGMSPYNLCIRLIRQAHADVSLPSARKREIYQFAVAELRKLLIWAPSDVDRSSIYHECIADISRKSPCATGSIAAINTLLGSSPKEDIETLVSTSEIIPLIISEFAHLVDSETTKMSSFQLYSEPLTVRLSLLEQVIVHIPDSITSELGDILWNSMLGAHALSEQARDAAWNMLDRVARVSSSTNSFLDRCFQDYLPNAGSQCLTTGVLPFAEQVVQYETRISTYSGPKENGQRHLPGSDLLWHISLSASHQSLGEKAVSLLVYQYLGSPGIRSASQEMVNEIYVKLVERCINQLKSASEKLKNLNDGTSSGGEEDSMVIVASEKETVREKVHFIRSLHVLKEFIQGIRSRTLLSPSPRLLQREVPDLRGTKVCIRYQPFSGGSNRSIQTIEVGDLETLGDLAEHIASLTGFSKFTAIQGGQKLDLETYSNKAIRELKLDQKGLILVRKASDASPMEGSRTAKRLRPLELEVMKYFTELYRLLGIDNLLAKNVFDFLITFPPHDTVMEAVCAEDASADQQFPPDSPYQGLYSVYALKASLLIQLQDGTMSQNLILHGIRLIIDALATLRIVDISYSDVITAAGLIDCLLQFLKEPVSSDTSAKYFLEPSMLVDCLHRLIVAAPSIKSGPEISSLIRKCFASMLEASLHSKTVWTCFKTHQSTSQLLSKLLIESNDRGVREGVVVSMKSVCGEMPTPTQISRQDFLFFFWESIVAIVPNTPKYPKNAEQFFNVALEIFRSMDENARDELPLAAYVKDWGDLLLEREDTEFVGRDGVDWIIFGLTSLLDWCIRLMKSKKKPLNIDGNLMQEIYRTHLFPDPAYDRDITTPARFKKPILHSPTRGKMYSMLLALSNDVEGFERLLDLIQDLLPPGENSNGWWWGFAQPAQEYHYDPNWNFERWKAIRSPTGYSGLRNLSNTCYLNSLFTQLFMNVSFRDFMLNTELVDAESSQKLLSETKRLFSYMQGTWIKAVDPQGIADSGINYESTPIDVSVQMDVDEFYNLLFAKWESQIVSKPAKEAFSQFYGGKIVQQIHAQPCGHISERLEPFAAIQCEIQGKASLLESLSAYIGGETMSGDNKYACQGCGGYRDATKRASFKDVPNNLIFHLKRFEYDVATGMRSKVNDQFEFPESLDMTPYTVEYLTNPDQPAPPDMFNLVGVLVHTGTAESGHYYSYIRERPNYSNQPNTWLEFNDADVSRFDPSNIPEQCFGGWSDGSNHQMRFPKPWSAYMLFYQRTNSMEIERQKYIPVVEDVPVKAEIPYTLKRQIAQDNTVWIRNYCLFDPEHMRFTRSLLDHLRDLNKDGCSDDHRLEKKVIWAVLAHVDQVLSRAKDCSEYEVVLKVLTDIAGCCARCSKLILDWVSYDEQAVRNLLLRNPNPLDRAKFSNMIIGVLRHLRNQDPRLYGFEIDTVEQDPQIDQVLETQGAFYNLIETFRDLWNYIYVHHKAWDDYFGLLRDLASLGRFETHTMLRAGILKQCLEVLIVEYAGAKRLRIDYPHLGQYYRLLEKGRKFSQYNLVALLDAMLKWVDLELTPVENGETERLPSDRRYPLTKYEDLIMRFGSDVPRLQTVVFLRKVLGSSNNLEAGRSIVRMMVLAEPSFGILQNTSRTILTGITTTERAELSDPYLHAALAFCEVCPTAQDAKEVMSAIAHDVETIGHFGGEQYLNFFSQARRIRNDRLPRRNPLLFHRLVLSHVPKWAPILLMYPEDSVRKETTHLLKTLVFNYDVTAMDDEQQAEEIETIAKELCRKCLQRMKEQYIKHSKPVEEKHILESTQVVRHCLAVYFTGDDLEELQEVEDADTTLDQVQALTVSTPEEALSDTWEGGSDILTDSESELVFLS